ncbi:Sec23-binding domain of Sec16 domain containing protein [Amanita muscaria]
MSSSIFSQSPPPISSDAFGPPKSNRYNVDERRAASPGSQPIRSSNGRQSTKPQSGVRPPSRIGALRGRSTSNGSALGSSEHYVPPQYPRSQLQGTEPGPVLQAPLSVSQPIYPAVEHPTIIHDLFAKSQAPYAPSPSLLGTNDPLGRTSARAPVISFGFGGKLVACFHGSNTLNTGFDVALASRRTTSVEIHRLSKVIPSSTLDVSASSFPGPLFSDPGASSSSLVRTSASGQKNKKAGVLKYLTEKAEEISHGLGYLTLGSVERRQAEGKLVLVKLLKAMIENDGRLSGSPSVEGSVRAALVPRLDGTLGVPTPEFTTTADTHALHSEASSMGPESVISVSTLRSSSLDRIQEYLLRGERRQAYHYALDEKLWAHAMVIASSIDKDAWKEVIAEFLRAELSVKDDVSHGTSYKGKDSQGSSSNGREALKMAYSLYSGQGPASIQELVPQTLLGHATAKLQIQNATPAHVTPRTPNFLPPPPTTSIPPETLAKWAEIVAMMVSTAVNAETSAALTALGDQLLASQYVEAAHACYLLAPQTSLMGGLGNPAVRIVLVGSSSPAAVPNFSADLEPIIFSEIVEFALSLSPITKGQEAFAGLPHLQAYRFIRAVSLAEIGEIQLANRYCEAISASLGRSSPYFTSTLLDQLRGLADRIGGISHVDKSSSWMGSKIGKPSLDSIGGWLEGRFTKLVTGEADSSAEAQERTSLEERMFSGPFSTISSATPSARSSPQPTPATVSLTRTDSAMPFSSQNPYNPVDRAASAMDHYKPKVASAPRVVSAGPAITSFSQSQSRLYGGQDRNSSDLGTDSSTYKMTNGDGQEAHTWWGGSGSYNYNDSASAKTPTATSFMRIDESAVRTTPDGFISLMDAPTFSATAVHDSPRPPTLPEEDDDEDLGLGNTKYKEKTATENGTPTGSAPSEPQKPAESEKNAKPPDTSGSSSGSWLSRLWKREAAAPGPVKASLGDESSFYYDKDLKRWVNKKGGTDDAAAKPAPPPPSRAQTASPSMNSARLNVPRPPNTGTSAIDLSTSPPIRSTIHVRSNLAPPPGLDSKPSTPPGMRLGPNGPPPSRPRSQASTKRNLRSRYVDVLQPEAGGS